MVSDVIQRMSENRLRVIRLFGERLWSRHSKFDSPQAIQQRIKEICDGDDFDTDFILDTDKLDGPATAAVWGSGSFSTGRHELVEARLAKESLGKNPIEYSVVVSNKTKSNAKAVAEEFDKPLVLVDFGDWYRKNYDSNSKKPITETTIFFPPGSERPEQSELEHRFKVRKEFDATIRDAIFDCLCYLPDSHSLRGYNFPIMADIGQVDDTHPAALDFVDFKTGHPLYPGWQSGAVQLMIDDNHEDYYGSLIEVNALSEISLLDTVDAGALLALGGGYKPEKPYDAKEIQEVMKHTEDFPLLTLKSWGIFPYLWAKTRQTLGVEYKTLDYEDLYFSYEPVVIVG